MHRARASLVIALNIEHKFLSRLQLLNVIGHMVVSSTHSLIPRPSPVFDQYAKSGKARDMYLVHSLINVGY